MNLNLTADQISELKIKFNAWQEVQERKKELAEENKMVCKDAAEIFEGKQTEASKLFKAMQELWDGAEAEVNNISLLLDRIHGGDGTHLDGAD